MTYKVSITGIIHKCDRKYLVVKRSSKSKNFPNRWTVPGGKLHPQDFIPFKPDGDYWHNPKYFPIGVERDKKQTNYLESKGYKVLRFTETEINNNIKLCLKQVKGEINGQSSFNRKI